MSEEREFIHNMAGPLAGCILLVDSLSDTIPAEQFTLLKSALDKLEALLRARREALIGQPARNSNE